MQLPIFADVSGLTQITTKPITLNSALVCKTPKVTIEEGNIFITVVTEFAKPDMSAKCPPALLGNIKAGRYLVFYRSHKNEVNFLREIFISSKPQAD